MTFKKSLLGLLLVYTFTSSLAQNPIQYGIWERYASPSGYHTDLAIGNIPGEPTNRVYMCEHPGSPSAGLYKGSISGETITWDASYGLPNARFFLNGGIMVLYFGVGDLADAGKYRAAAWTNTCGPLANQTKKIVIGVDPTEYGIEGRSISITIQNINAPYTSFNNVLQNPTCSFTLPSIGGEYYNVKISASGEGVSGPTTQVYNSVLYKSELTKECNTLRVTYTGPTIALTAFDVGSFPAISSFAPTSGSVGSSVTITGTNFATIPANNAVTFGGATAVVTASTATTITTTVPAGAVTGKIAVMVNGQLTATSSSNFTVVVPSITGFTPQSGTTGTPVTITGTAFSTTPANNVVKFGNTPAVVTASTATTISTMVPPGSITGKITVTVGSVALTSATDFTNTTLAITGFSPTSGMVGEDVIITGTNFSLTPSENSVKFNTTSAVITSLSTTSLRVKVPTGATSGPISVTTDNQTATSATSFKVCPTIALSVSTTNNTSFTMSASGGVAPYTFSFDGTNFISGVDVLLSPPGPPLLWARDANGCKTSSRVQINGLVACGTNQQASGPASSTFTTHSLGSQSGLVRIEYDMVTKPDQMDVYYNNELVATTGSAVINKGFLSFNYDNDPAKPKFCVIKINTPDNSNEWNYTALCPAIPIPKITAFAPVYGKAGTPVTIQGYNFSSGTVVKFGTTLATSPAFNSSGTQITVNVPAGAASAPIIVSNNFGASVTATDFTVSPYCLSLPSSDDGSKINIVKFGNIAVSSPVAACESYTDNSSLIGYLTAGGTYDLKIFVGTCSTNSNKAVRAFIDWNGDFDFADAGEIVATSTASAPGTREETFSVTVPASLTVASTRMRIVLANTNTPTTITDCGTYSFGETEDYTLSFVTAGTPVKNASPSTLPEFEALVGLPSVVRSIAVSGSSLGTTSFVVTAPAHFQVSNQATAGFASSVTIAPVSGTIGTIVYVRYLPTAAGTHTGNVTVTNSLVATPSTIAVSGKATAPTPSLLVNALFDDFYFTVSGGQTNIQQFTIEGSFLTGNVTIAASANFRFSLTTSGFSQLLTVTPTAGTIAQRIVYVQYTPGNLVAPTSETITISSPGFTNQTIPVTGKFSPVVTTVAPTSGIAGTTVVISGQNFSATPAKNVVRFGGIQSVVTASTPNSITTTVPTVAAGPLQVTVGPGATLGSASFTVISSTPTITSLSPTTGPIGTSVTITGTNFSATPGNNIVKFNSTPAIVTASTQTSITTTVPAGATTGPVTVTVGTETNSNTVIFLVPVPTPAIASFSPTGGPTGTSVTITGTNFSTTAANNTVRFNGIVATVTGTPTATNIVATVPSGATTGKITIQVGAQVATSSGDFTVTLTPPPGVPTITGFSPASGAVGTTVTITGTNFSTTAANNTVLFDGAMATVIGTPTATSIVVTVPPGAQTGKVAIDVGGMIAISPNDFIVTTPGSHTVTGFNPTSGPVGTSVTITGTNFSGTPANNTIKFNGTTAVVTGSTPTSIVTTVPAGATTGKITVTVGGQVVSSTTDFTVMAPGTPTITSFSPANGLAGTAVTITGTNFSTTAANNTVKFNGTTATITGTPTATTIVTVVPAAATSGKITVQVGGLVGTSSSDFTVGACAKPPKPTITATNLDTASPVLTSSSATGNQWFLNGSAIANANGASLNVTAAGVYKTQVTVTGGCFSDFSDDFAIVVTGITSPEPILNTYYPNPVDDRLIVETSQTGLKSMRLFHADGKQVHQVEFETTSVEVDVRYYPTGMYYFIVTSVNGTVTGKFVKQ